MIKDVHEWRDHLTIWLRSNIKKQMHVHWETNEGFKRRCLIKRANRDSVRSSKNTNGSATFIKTKARLFKLLDHDMKMAETFKYTHTLKENNERFADQQAADRYVSKHHVI
ncbi:hypothetical protein Ahy_B09g096085 isoform B [Arachis hypogaea]|nr:hypothetical protein Ahy_B09g096085 isoform B [Arachis hypogaea]